MTVKHFTENQRTGKKTKVGTWADAVGPSGRTRTVWGKSLRTTVMDDEVQLL